MSPAIRPVGHEEKLTLVDHLDELRTRLMISGAVLAVAFGVCLWQNHALLHIVNKPLARCDVTSNLKFSTGAESAFTLIFVRPRYSFG